MSSIARRKVKILLRCPICLESYPGLRPQDLSETPVVTRCGHVAHLGCAKKWVDHARKCFACPEHLRVYEYVRVGPTGRPDYPDWDPQPREVLALAGYDLEAHIEDELEQLYDLPEIVYISNVLYDTHRLRIESLRLGRGDSGAPGEIAIDLETGEVDPGGRLAREKLVLWVSASRR